MLRPYTSVDTDDVVEVWYRASLVAHPFLSLAFLEEERSEIRQHWLPAAETTVYEEDSRVVGFISLIDNEVGGIFVDPDHHGRGIGRSLLDHARQSRDFLELGVFEKNHQARRFYESYGFEVVERQIDERTGEPELRLRLDYLPDGDVVR